MEFFGGQESLNAIQWSLRAIIGFFFLVIVAKLMGQRSISQLRFLDFVMAILIGNIIAHPLSDEQLGLKGSMITMSVLVISYLTVVFLSLRWDSLRKIFDPPPIPLIEYGKINYKNLNKARISVDILLSELRKEKTEDIQKVALALWEPGGTISIFLYPQHKPITHSNFNSTLKPFDFPKIIIKEQKIDYNVLNQLGIEEQWLLNKIKTTYNVNLSDILLATIENNEDLKIYLYN
ncbi:DUF421 domain-containing protein [Virgibacillus pantothenticus]|uniref:DUF421 domain-containing protein n=1 Tax=Virgibacillus pantothenticus TaxID=1473 RepID=UPI001C243367|nr:DUF421 domain-containing protein [Virgibacillus pantothenticus]MBU8568111.1 DUF421 domain-containing protein [Virgibacillus pantothenticus]MBU8602057.1 DUF421 domain-containing protein [Virgibacillus pantothenticus]MBU8636307.1 DUF421 domain-containing protein [Virgibacillus pantothenticus]MBU8643827.1 DUF421 domain-containing protein [Virgibacillus pantothenticus]MBU8648143.1 DUF421 domain-containing protein [Virgibacillus pantothenticus]